jgi:hypothetical protein
VVDFNGVLIDALSPGVGGITKKSPQSYFGSLLRVRTGAVITSAPIPFISGLDPASGEIGVDRTTNVELSILAPPCGVSLSSVTIEISINGGPYAFAFKDAVFQSGYNAVGSAVQAILSGYRFTIDPALLFPAGATIGVRINAANIIGNPMPTETYFFFTAVEALTDDPVPTEFGPDRQDEAFTIRDSRHGKVNIRVIDRIGIDDVVLHLIERELFRLNGGADPGVDVSPNFIDFLVREKLVKR